MVPEAKRSPGRVDAPLTVMWASIWAGDQYIVRYGGRVTTSPLSSISTSMSMPWGAPGPRAVGGAGAEVGEGLGALRGQVHPRGLEGGERGHPRRDRGRERLAEERPERD